MGGATSLFDVRRSMFDPPEPKSNTKVLEIFFKNSYFLRIYNRDINLVKGGWINRFYLFFNLSRKFCMITKRSQVIKIKTIYKTVSIARRKCQR